MIVVALHLSSAIMGTHEKSFSVEIIAMPLPPFTPPKGGGSGSELKSKK